MSEGKVERDIETGDVDIEMLPESSPPLIFSHSSPPATNTGKKILIEGDSPRQRAASDPLKKKPLKLANNFLPLPPQLKLTLSRKQSQSLFYCHICFENHAERDAFTLESCDCQHRFCKSCIQSLLRIQVNDGQVDFACPLFGECQGHFSVEEIDSIAEDETKEKFHRFYEIKKDPDYRECPQCSHPTHGNKSKPEMVCESCQSKFCYYHSNAHPNSTCAEFNRQQLRNERDAMKAIKSISRNCPSCGAATEKNGGCNHMTCRQCGENWCWLCGRHMDNDHYDATNLAGCPGQQFASAPSFALWTHVPPWCHTCLIYFVRILLFLIVLPIGIALGCLAIAIVLPLAIICSPCLCFFMCDDDLDDTCFSQLGGQLLLGAAALLLFLIWIPIAIAFSPIAVVLFAFSILEFEPWIYVIGPAVYPLIFLFWHEDD